MDYNYTVMNDKGKTLNGTISADTMEIAVDELKRGGFYVVEMIEGTALEKNIKIKLFKGIKTKDLAFFCRQMATLLKAGINVLSSFELIRNQADNKSFAVILGNVYEMVEKGNPVCTSMSQFPKAFPTMLVNMVEAGEVSGTIDQSFDKMAQYYEKQQKLKSKVKNALVYPAFVLGLAIIVINLLVIFVLPTFVSMFNTMNVELPGITKAVLGFANFMSKYWYAVILFISLVIWLYNIYKKTPSGAVTAGRYKLKIPIAGKIIINRETSLFSRTLATLFTSGVSLVPALYTVQKLMNNKYISEQLDFVISRVKGGERLSEPIESIRTFPSLVPVMIRTGEESGKLDTMLEQLADYYETQVDNSITRLIALFEPVMMVILALFVGLLMVSIMLPMFKLYGSF